MCLWCVGGALNNLEFNEYPDEPFYDPAKSPTLVRRVFLNAFWAKGGTARYWIVPPSMTLPNLSFYFSSKMRISPRDVLQVLLERSENEWLNVFVV